MAQVILTLQRLIISDGAFGHLLGPKGDFICCTMERLFDGKPKIPEGKWTFIRYHSPHFGFDVFRCDTVPGHTALEIHIANFVEELEGCVALGTQIAIRPSTNGHMLTASKIAFDAFMKTQVGVDSIDIMFQD
jgi:hypothetical protein